MTELSTRHSLITKQKQFTSKPKLKSTSSKLTGWLNNNENVIHVEDDEKPPEILQEQAEHVPELRDIPESNTGEKRKGDDADDTLFVSSSDEEFFATQRAPASKRRRQKKIAAPVEEIESGSDNNDGDTDDKKKLALNTLYDGFSIYGRILCLVVKRKGKKATASNAPGGGSQMMEQWISTQAAQEAGLNDDEDG